MHACWKDLLLSKKLSLPAKSRNAAKEENIYIGLALESA